MDKSNDYKDYQKGEKKNNKKWLLLLLLLLFLCLSGYVVFRIGFSVGKITRPVTPEPKPQRTIIKITDDDGEWKTIDDLNRADKIEINPYGLSLDFGESHILYAVSTLTGPIHWTSSDDSCVTVSPTEGSKTIVTARNKECTAVITALVGDVTTEVVIHVKRTHDKLEGIQLGKSDYIINIGESELVTVIAEPITAKLPDLIYKIEDTGIATVDKNGVITGVSEGETKIVVTTVDGSFTAVATITIKKKSSDDDTIKINPSGLSLEPGESQTIFASTTSKEEIQWTSSDDSCVSISPNNGAKPTVTAGDKECSAVVTAKVGDVTSEIIVNVVKTQDKLEGIKLDKSNYNIYVGNSELASVKAVPITADLPKLIYKIENPGIATVDENGVITGVSEGTTKLTVTTVDGSYSTSAIVTIKEKTSSGDKLKINPSALSLEPGESHSLFASTTSKKEIQWTSSDNSCVSVSPKKGANTTVTAGTKECTATITAKSGNLTSKIVVNVVKTHKELEGIQLDRLNYVVYVGKTDSALVNAVPTTAELPDLIYTIEDTGIATVDENGVITGVSVGTTKITVTTVDGTFSATAIVTVREEPNEDEDITRLNIFSTTTSANEYIAPYDTGTYEFTVENTIASNITYTLSLEEENVDRVNIKYKLKKGGSYIISNWTYYNEIRLEDIPLASGDSDSYELIWSWVSENDELDTAIGLKRERAEYYLTIKVVAVQE